MTPAVEAVQRRLDRTQRVADELDVRVDAVGQGLEAVLVPARVELLGDFRCDLWHRPTIRRVRAAAGRLFDRASVRPQRTMFRAGVTPREHGDPAAGVADVPAAR